MHTSFFFCKFAAEYNTTARMKKLLPWFVGLGILAFLLIFAANIYDSMTEEEEQKEEPVWVQQDDSVAVEVAIHD